MKNTKNSSSCKKRYLRPRIKTIKIYDRVALACGKTAADSYPACVDLPGLT